MKKLVALLLFLVVLFTLFTGCSGSRIKLTEEQEANIDMMIKWREEWKEYTDFVDCVPANRLHIAEFTGKDGSKSAFLTVAHFKGDAFVSRGYLVNSEAFIYVDMAHNDWFSDCVTVDLEGMSDEELREVLRELYIAYLEKKAEK